MTLTELQSILKDKGLVAIVVENSPPAEQSKRLIFSGTLEEYLEAVKALQERAVLVYSENLDDTDFKVDSDDLEDENDAIGLSTTNLCEIDPKLEAFKEHLGEQGLLWLSIQIKEQHLDLVLEEEWWQQFLDMRDKAIDRHFSEQEELEVTARARERAKTIEIIERLHTLVDDPKFSVLPTQKAMLHYALRKFPALKELPSEDAKAAIQELKAKIDAGVV